MIEFENMSDTELVKAFRQMTDQVLHEVTAKTAAKERKIISLLRQLNEIERRHLYSKSSVDGLHGYCVKELKMGRFTSS